MKLTKTEWNDSNIKAFKEINTMTELPAKFLKQFPKNMRNNIKIHWDCAFSAQFWTNILEAKQKNQLLKGTDEFDPTIEAFLTEAEIQEAVDRNEDLAMDCYMEISDDIDRVMGEV